MRTELTASVRVLLSATAFLACSLSGSAQVVEYYHLDGLGSVRAVTNQNGDIVERHDYLPWGEEHAPGLTCPNGPGTCQPVEFTGKERDAETGQDYFGARYYGSKIGRFTAVDPVYNWEEGQLDPQRWNRYAYALNNTLRYVDPDGRDVSIGLRFTGDGWTPEDKAAVIDRVKAWYEGNGVGQAYVFDEETAAHGGRLFQFRSGFASLEVSRERNARAHRRDKVFAGNFDYLPQERRRNAIANSIVHETAAHWFGATLGAQQDLGYYMRDGYHSRDPEVRRRYGTVADAYAFATEKDSWHFTDGPIPINPDDRQTLLEKVGPFRRLAPPAKR